jgi:hypothetical protein
MMPEVMAGDLWVMYMRINDEPTIITSMYVVCESDGDDDIDQLVDEDEKWWQILACSELFDGVTWWTSPESGLISHCVLIARGSIMDHGEEVST